MMSAITENIRAKYDIYKALPLEGKLEFQKEEIIQEATKFAFKVR